MMNSCHNSDKKYNVYQLCMFSFPLQNMWVKKSHFSSFLSTVTFKVKMLPGKPEFRIIDVRKKCYFADR